MREPKTNEGRCAPEKPVSGPRRSTSAAQRVTERGVGILYAGMTSRVIGGAGECNSVASSASNSAMRAAVIGGV
jgi:hypothetical protein